MLFEFLEDFAIADVAFVATGATLSEVLTACCEATLNTMVEDLDSVRPRTRKLFHLECTQLDLLLFDLLNELVFWKDAECLLLRIRDVSVEKKNSSYQLEAVAEGETLDPQRHIQRADVKAVTLHQFRLDEKSDGSWEALVILDV